MVDPDRDAAEECESFLASCPHLFDPFASDIRARFGTRDLLNSNECKVLFIVLLCCLRLTLARIECRHSAPRRLKALSSQTWTPELTRIAVAFVMIRQRVLQLQTRKLAKRVEAEQAAAAKKPSG